MANDKKYKINIDPRILELLGPSLYTNIYYILAELIANAYDANASNVYIIQKDDRLIVEDDGNGMSYDEGDIDKFLNVAVETRVTGADAYVKGSNNRRKKMGRKGVGKLAALSVSENVDVLTVKNGEKSGFILSRNVPDNHELKPLPEESVVFEKITNNGTAIVMRNPQYRLHKTLPAIKNNLLKIFPLVNSEFKIHIVQGAKIVTIDSFEKEIIQGLGGLITLGNEFGYLSASFDCQLKDRKVHEKNLLLKRDAFEKVLFLKKKDGNNDEFLLRISGWIGVYRSSRGKKNYATDFPDNFISLISNRKLGEYNILPMIGKNALNEVYIVGQLHVDLFEETDLPDMALSNRQGYKTDDIRYQEVIKFVRDDILPKAVSLRAKYGSYYKDQNNQQKDAKNTLREQQLRKQVEEFKKNAASSAAKKLMLSMGEVEGSESIIEELVGKAINMHLPDMGLKSAVDDAKKKLLISHTSKDKSVADFMYNLFLNNGVPPQDIIYTSSDNAESRVPQKQPIFDYLREFFVDSYSSEKILVLYVTSDDMAGSWAAVSEVGAGWVTKRQHDIVNINKHVPQRPLDTECEWANVVKENDNVFLSPIEADKIAEKVMYICNAIGYKPKDKALILQDIAGLSNIET